MGGGKKRIPPLYPVILMIVFSLALLPVQSKVRADDGPGGEDAAITVTMPVEISLVLDTSDPSHPVFSGCGELYGITGLAASHRYVTVTLPESFEMETPAGTKEAPDGTSVVWEGSINARKGYENYKAKHGLFGLNGDNLRAGTIRVEIPLTADFVTYGEGDYSLTIPVTLTVGEAYGSYSEDYDFTPWAELVSGGGVTVNGTKLTRVSMRDMILEIEPGITELNSNLFSSGTYRDVWIPNTVSGGENSMNGSAVEQIAFEDGFTNIPDSICRNASQLKGAVIPEGVTTFGQYCFCGCRQLSDFVFPDSMTTINACAFQNCESLEEIEIRRNLTVGASYSGSAPFQGAGLKKITVDEGVTQIPNYLFTGGCSRLAELTFPESLERIGYEAFNGAVLLKELEIRSNVTIDGYYSPFEGSGIETLTFSDGVTTIPRCLFSNGCDSLTTLNLPESVSFIGSDAFENAKNLKKVEIKNNITIGNNSTVVSPFEGAGIEEIVVHDGVTTIPRYLFSKGCDNLTKLELPSSLTFIGPCAFENCKSLKKVEIRSDVTIGNNSTVVSPFQGGGLEEIVIADGVTAIPGYLFKDACNSLVSLTLPEGLVSIGNDAFSSCPQLAELELPESLEIIGAASFEDCASVKEIRIRSDLSLPRYTYQSPFLGSGIERVIVEEGVTKLPANLFANGCSGMTSLELPESLQYVEAGCFENCTSLTSLVIRSNIGMSNRSSVVSSFGNSALNTIRFADGVTEIGKLLLENKDGEAITVYMPASITKMDASVFEENTSVDLMFAGTEEQWESVNKNGWTPTSITFGVQPAGAGRVSAPMAVRMGGGLPMQDVFVMYDKEQDDQKGTEDDNQKSDSEMNDEEETEQSLEKKGDEDDTGRLAEDIGVGDSEEDSGKSEENHKTTEDGEVSGHAGGSNTEIGCTRNPDGEDDGGCAEKGDSGIYPSPDTKPDAADGENDGQAAAPKDAGGFND